MKYFKLIILMFVCVSLNAQIIKNDVEVDFDSAKRELTEKGISEEEVRARLAKKGFDQNNIDPTNIDEFQKAYQEVVKEIEQEKDTQPQEFDVNDEQNFKVESNSSKEEIKESIIEDAKEKVAEQILEDSIKVTDILVEEPEDELTFEERLDKNYSLVPQDDRYVNEVYGHSLFSTANIEAFNTTEEVTIPRDYVLASGDEVMVSIFGRSQADFSFKIDKSGNISAARVGKIYLRGLTLDQAENKLRKRFARAYSFLPEQFQLTLNAARSITVGIFGEVGTSGSYELNALNSPINALMVAGGIREAGSVRKIKIIKNSGKEIILDLYKYIANPNYIKDIKLENNDMIHVPISGDIVKILGAIKRPMKYELNKGETLDDLIKYSGGTREFANTNSIQVARVNEGGKKILDVNLSRARSFQMKGMDEVFLRNSSLKFREFVSIFGQVDYPGKYEWRNGLTLQEVLDKGVFGEFARKDLVFIYRKGQDGYLRLETVNLDNINPRSIKLNPRDRVSVLSLSLYADKPLSIKIEGAVREPKSIEVKDDQIFRLSDFIQLSGGLLENAFSKATITRKDRSNGLKTTYEVVDVFNAIQNPSSVDNILLKEGDLIKIFTNEKFLEREYFVGIAGDVKDPVELKYDESLTIQQLLLMAGGLRNSASDKAILMRKSKNNNIDIEYIEIDIRDIAQNGSDLKLQARDRIIVYNEYEFREEFNVQVKGEVNNPGVYKYDKSLSLEKLLYMSGGLTSRAAGNNVDIYRVEFRENKSNLILHKKISIVKNNKGYLVPSEDITIAPYDVIIIRPIPNYNLQQIVTVKGEVQYPGPYIIDDNTKLTDIVEDAGGLTDRAFPLGATLIRSDKDGKNGRILINLKDAMSFGRKHENITLLPGDVLSIPRNEDVISIRVNATRANKEYSDNVLVDNKLQIAFQGKKSAKWYIDNFAGGFLGKDIDRKSVRVIEPSGRVRGTKKILGIYDYPTVIKGSVIAVDYKVKELEEQQVGNPIDWTKTITDSLAILSSAISIIILSRRIND